ncbi:MAG: NADH-quinone oxidoreductase subunit N [Candidatus Eisenbacteria bacterium]|nr:NADH-quinone oxidoreductase subunit N [Candidatus Eisenbacteria bacterium]
MNLIDWHLVSPELFLGCTGIAVLMIDLLLPAGKKAFLWWLSLIGIAGAFVMLVGLWGESQATLSGMFVLDPFSLFFKGIFLVASFLVLLITPELKGLDLETMSEYCALLLFGTFGFMLVASAGDLVMIFVAIEMGAIPCYALAGFMRDDASSNEAGVKYFLLGAISSAVMVYGMSFIYGLTGLTNLLAIEERLLAGGASYPLLMLGSILTVAGFAFKMAAVPFHMWVPDTYQGAPTPITAYLSVVSKGAGFAVLLRFIFSLSGAYQANGIDWTGIIAWLSALSMILGTIVGVAQTNVKRLLAYSSIAHVGYMLIGVAVGGTLGTQSVLIYLTAYLFMSVGAFSIVTAQSRITGGDDLEHFVDLGRRSPVMAGLMTIFLLSLAGIPGLAGFMGKLYVFSSAIKDGYIVLAVIGILTSVVSLFYYARVLKAMYLVKRKEEQPHFGMSALTKFALGISFVFTLFIGLFPAQLIRLTEASLELWLGR